MVVCALLQEQNSGTLELVVCLCITLSDGKNSEHRAQYKRTAVTLAFLYFEILRSKYVYLENTLPIFLVDRVSQ